MKYGATFDNFTCDRESSFLFKKIRKQMTKGIMPNVTLQFFVYFLIHQDKLLVL